MSTKYMYLRSVRQNSPAGCIAYTVDKSGDISYQASVVNPSRYTVPGGETVTKNGYTYVTKERVTHDTFNRTQARTLAEEKLKKDPITFNMNDAVKVIDKSYVKSDHHSAWEPLICLMSTMSDSRQVPGRVSKIAKEWMKVRGFVKKDKVWVRRNTKLNLNY